MLGNQRAHAQTVSGKIGYAGANFQDGFSGYDEFDDSGLFPVRIRASRWGYYALAHHGPWSLIGEVVAGTDLFHDAFFGTGDSHVNRLGWFAETDYQVNRGVNLRVRYDRLETRS